MPGEGSYVSRIASVLNHKSVCMEFPGGLAPQGFRVVTAVAQVRPLAQELPHAMGIGKRKKKLCVFRHVARIDCLASPRVLLIPRGPDESRRVNILSSTRERVQWVSSWTLTGKQCPVMCKFHGTF